MNDHDRSEKKKKSSVTRDLDVEVRCRNVLVLENLYKGYNNFLFFSMFYINRVILNSPMSY